VGGLALGVGPRGLGGGICHLCSNQAPLLDSTRPANAYEQQKTTAATRGSHLLLCIASAPRCGLRSAAAGCEC
jgi:hypothetical protein